MGAIKRWLQRDRIQTREEVIRAIQIVWSEFQQGSIDGFVASFSNRMQMVWEAEGRTVQPLISAGKTTVLPGYATASGLHQSGMTPMMNGFLSSSQRTDGNGD
jgi:hypothetical protein